MLASRFFLGCLRFSSHCLVIPQRVRDCSYAEGKWRDSLSVPVTWIHGEHHRLVAPLTLVVTGEAYLGMCVFPKNRIPQYYVNIPHFLHWFSPHETWQWKQWSWLGVPHDLGTHHIATIQLLQWFSAWFAPGYGTTCECMILQLLVVWARLGPRSLVVGNIFKIWWVIIGISPGFKHQTSGRLAAFTWRFHEI